MAFRKSMFDLLANATKSAALSVKKCRIASSSTSRLPSTRSWNPSQNGNGNGNGSYVRRFLHRGAVYQQDTHTSPFVIGLKEKHQSMRKERLNLDGLTRPDLIVDETRQDQLEKVLGENVDKFLEFVLLNAAKGRLEAVKESWITHERFVEMCSEDCGKEEGLRIAGILDESGAVIVLGKMVFLRPQQVVKTIRGLIPAPAAVRPDDALKKELEELEKEKAVIDKKADDLVRRELWCGLAFMVAQTAGFMRLTFWELTWDVIEPICFCVTSIYFMAGYAFFLRTSIEPSFEGFFQSRLKSKQKKLMKLNNFNIGRYNELKKACSPNDMLSFNPLPFDPLHLKRGGNDGWVYQ